MAARKATAAVPAEVNKLPFFEHVQYQLSGARIVNLLGEVSMGTMAHVVNTLQYLQLQDTKKPIEMRMNTPGGSVIDGLAIYDAVWETTKTTPVNITVNGACMSMGTIILQAATERRAFENSQFLLHEISYGIGGSHSSHKDHQKQAERLQNTLNGILTSRSKLTPKKLVELIERKDYTISAQEALEVGLIDRIIK